MMHGRRAWWRERERVVRQMPRLSLTRQKPGEWGSKTPPSPPGQLCVRLVIYVFCHQATASSPTPPRRSTHSKQVGGGGEGWCGGSNSCCFIRSADPPRTTQQPPGHCTPCWGTTRSTACARMPTQAHTETGGSRSDACVHWQGRRMTRWAAQAKGRGLTFEAHEVRTGRGGGAQRDGSEARGAARWGALAGGRGR